MHAGNHQVVCVHFMLSQNCCRIFKMGFERRSPVFTKIEQPDLLRKIVAQIKHNISTGQLAKGDKLLSERQMAEMFGLSRATVREAIKALDMLGLVECSHGSGNYISSNLSNSLSEPLSIMFMLEGGNIEQTHELRRAIEFAAAGAAARRIKPDSLKHLNSLCSKIENSADENEKAKYDLEFHYEIAAASQNPLLVTLLNAAETLISEHIQDARAGILRIRGNEAIINRQHRELLDALGRGDAEAAERTALAHMELIHKNIFQKEKEDVPVEP
jgi:GntR family transcriptional repressor for pyruvate dehydrogenase complex